MCRVFLDFLDLDFFISPLNQQINIQNDGKINKII